MTHHSDSMPAPTNPKPAKGRNGRPIKKTLERVTKLLSLIAGGLSIRSAAHTCGLSETTIYKWRDADAAFEEQVQFALADSERKLIELAMEGAKRDGRVALMMLERRFPESWSKRTNHAHIHADLGGGNILAELVAARKKRDAELAAVTVTVE